MHIHERGAFVRFALAHLIATNLSVWLRTLANEIMNEYNHFNHNLLMKYAAAVDPSSNSTTGKPL
jgi:Otopetrin